jgi:beta-glucanase (GH16 family)
MYFPIFCFFLLACGKSGSNDTPTPPEADPHISINDVGFYEGNSGVTNFPFAVTLDRASTKAITVTFSTKEGTASAGSDFVAVTNQVLTFQPNETSKTINISVNADDIEEANEQFTVELSNPTNARMTKATATATIQNEDTKAAFNNAGYDAPSSYPGYTKVWSDEFDGPTLDLSAWTYETGNSGWGNNELEYYTNRTQNTSIQDGKLVIHALKENFGSASYTSARIKTQGKKEFQYGRVDIRAILPKTKGIWPALWMLGSNISTVSWPACGEIDIMELLGHEPAKSYGTLHWGASPATHAQKGSFFNLTSGTFSDQFHVFSMEWKQDEIKLYVDNNLVVTLNSSDVGSNNSYPFNQPFFFIFNIAVGGNWPGNPDATTAFPQWMIVDYVRVYRAQ